ncbi:MAG: tRNA lysidine(34) synthetase TilS, partial [Clostridiales Family XIII bacterium]|nr:tRNA lysidine(34) synthetase TilS [Clostridiales Family XIII bacterium]
RLRIILACLEKIGLSQDAAAVHLKAAERLALAGETGKRVEFPGGYRLRRVYGMLEFFREEPEESEAGYARESRSVSFSDIEAAALVRGRVTLVCGGDGRVFRFTAGLIEAERGETKPTLGNDDAGGGVCSAGQSAECGADTLELDFDSITSAYDGVSGLVIRRRQAGDWIRLSGMAGTKKLQDFFVNAKIRREQRERIPLLALGSEILWIPGYRKTGNYRAGGETKRVLTLTVSAEPAALPDETSPALNLSGSSEA